MKPRSLVAVVDYGSQYTWLIHKKLRRLGYAALHLDASVSFAEPPPNVRAVILSGGPRSVNEADAPGLPAGLLESGLPVLGVCYGMQLLNRARGGTVVSGTHREYGPDEVARVGDCPLFEGMPDRFPVLMSHGDAVSESAVAPGLTIAARTAAGAIAALADPAARLFAVQFHPETEHTPDGARLLENFARLAGIAPVGDLRDYIAEQERAIRDRLGADGRLFALVSGGVDSSVALAVARRAVDPARILAVHIDSGLMREGESDAVIAAFARVDLPLHRVDARAEFLDALRGLEDPEAKRAAIGDAFVAVADRVATEHGLLAESVFLLQGTLYTDLIESGAGVGRSAAKIKSHHNVASPWIVAKRAAGLVIEPNAGLFKDEVREVGRTLGLPDVLIDRQPFPGPGLAVRIEGEVTDAKVAAVRRADAIFQEERERGGDEARSWQAFAVLTRSRAVGVMGDERAFGSVVVLRAVQSVDGMTATAARLPWDVLESAARRIVNEVPGVTRVAYDLTPKPPGTIEWE